jgi:hypothetical protein
MIPRYKTWETHLPRLFLNIQAAYHLRFPHQTRVKVKVKLVIGYLHSSSVLIVLQSSDVLILVVPLLYLQNIRLSASSSGGTATGGFLASCTLWALKIQRLSRIFVIYTPSKHQHLQNITRCQLPSQDGDARPYLDLTRGRTVSLKKVK